MSAFKKDMFREIKNTMGRFISLLIITALGAASVVGIQAASIDMRDIADQTYKEQNLYDIQIKSSIGFDEDDISALTDAVNVSTVMPTYIYDVFANIENENRPVRTYALPDKINAIDVLDGRLPANTRECAVEQRMLDENHIKIGDKIKLGLDNMDDYDDVFQNNTFTVVGIVSSPLYISFERGNTMLGDGKLRYYMYLHKNAYKLDVYTDVYMLMAGSYDMDNLTETYYHAADGWKHGVEQLGTLRVKDKKDEIEKAWAELEDGWAEYFDGERELKEKIADARQELADAKANLTDAKAKLESGQRELDKKISDGLKEMNKQAAELEKSQKELNTRWAELDANQIQIDQARSQLEQTIDQLEPLGPSPELDAAAAALQRLDANQAELDKGRAALDTAQGALDAGFSQIDAARQTLEEERRKAQTEIDDGRAAYDEGLEEYNAGVRALETEEADALAELAEAKKELDDAQEKLDKIPTPEWFAFTRKDSLSFDSYYQDTLRLQKIGYVFPMVFFLVSVLVSLTSMSRMVEDHRTQIGIYKALGYRPVAVMLKYLVYAFSASMIGGIGGVVLGSNLFPVIIADAYGHLYDMPPVNTPIPMFISLLAIISVVLSVVLVTLITCVGSMTGSPALLIRPKPPAKGKRVLLERIPIIWNRLNFFGKVTARNIFRYKKRFIMTLAGVAGCSALLLTAFGLRDSIGGVADLQYSEIVMYDSRAYLKDIRTGKQRTELNAILPESHLYIREEAVTANGQDGGLPASLVIPDNPQDLSKYVSLHSPKTKDPVSMDSDSVIITEKLARVMGVSAGDSFAITLSNGSSYTAKITDIADNYILHFIYMSPSVYTKLFGEKVYPNSVLISGEDSRKVSVALLENSDVRAVIHNDEVRANIGNQTDAMDIVVIVLIILACALALVVLFNLTNINISERIRELATIKVLGFNSTELAMYIYRENAAVTMLGIGSGLIGGIFLHGFVLSTVEIDALKFPQIIHPISYAIAVSLSIAFALFVNLVMNFKLARIDMVESLKNVE